LARPSPRVASPGWSYVLIVANDPATRRAPFPPSQRRCSMTTRAPRPFRPGLALGLAVWIANACGAGAVRGADAIAWRTDLPSAEREARAQDRLLWVQFT